MSVVAVARKDYADAIRSRWLLVLTALFVLIVSLAAYIVRPPEGQTVSSNALLGSIVIDLLATTLVPITALVIGYNAISGERESGSLKLLLSLPHSRADVVFGKVIGRAAAFSTAIAVGFVLPALLLAIGPLTFDVGGFVGFVLLVCLLGSVFVAIAVGFSAAVSSQLRALAGAITLYLLFIPVWSAVQFPLSLWLMASDPWWIPLDGEQTMRLLTLLRPTGAFGVVSDALLQDRLFTGEDVRMQVSSLVMLVAWTLIPPLAGLLKFENTDL